jgi:hypothetical protein
MTTQTTPRHRQRCRDPAQDVADLLEFLLPSLPPSPPTASVKHMGRLLADVSLQSALNYERVVAPRVLAIEQLRPSLTKTSDIARHLEFVPAEELLHWNGKDKPRRFRSLVAACVKHDVETVNDLYEWTSTAPAKRVLLAIPGVGPKSYDYLRLLSGHDVFPIDRHYIRFLTLAGLDYKKHGYAGSQQLLTAACSALRLQCRDIERRLWLLMRECA